MSFQVDYATPKTLTPSRKGGACRALGLLVVPLLVSACATQPSFQGNQGVLPVPQDQARINFDVPAFADTAARRIKYEDSDQREEYALFRAKDGAQAEVIYTSLQGFSQSFSYIDYQKSIEDQVKTWNFNKDVTYFAPTTQFATDDRKLRVHRFKNADGGGRECFGFSREGERNPRLPGRPFTEMMFGYYCGAPGQALKYDDVATYARSVSFLSGRNATKINRPDADGAYHAPEVLHLAQTGKRPAPQPAPGSVAGDAKLIKANTPAGAVDPKAPGGGKTADSAAADKEKTAPPKPLVDEEGFPILPQAGDVPEVPPAETESTVQELPPFEAAPEAPRLFLDEPGAVAGNPNFPFRMATVFNDKRGFGSSGFSTFGPSFNSYGSFGFGSSRGFRRHRRH